MARGKPFVHSEHTFKSPKVILVSLSLLSFFLHDQQSLPFKLIATIFTPILVYIELVLLILC